MIKKLRNQPYAPKWGQEEKKYFQWAAHNFRVEIIKLCAAHRTSLFVNFSPLAPTFEHRADFLVS
jgi:hypothetical protein